MVEMIPDDVYNDKDKAVQHREAAASAPGSSAVTAVVNDNMEFWARMERLMERNREQINSTAESLGGRID